jgi:hypothetical protein
MSQTTSNAGATIVSLRQHIDGRQAAILRTKEGDYRWQLDGRKRPVSTERFATFFGAMVAANKFMDGCSHDCRRLGCESWLLGASLRAVLTPSPVSEMPVVTSAPTIGQTAMDVASVAVDSSEPPAAAFGVA